VTKDSKAVVVAVPPQTWFPSCSANDNKNDGVDNMEGFGSLLLHTIDSKTKNDDKETCCQSVPWELMKNIILVAMMTRERKIEHRRTR
jgi:hypothetical protein